MRHGRRSSVIGGTAILALTVSVVPALGASSPKPPGALRSGGLSLTQGSTMSAPKSWTATLARSDKALLHRTDAAPVNVMVKYDLDPPASYRGGAPGLEATSPVVTHRSLERNKTAVASYQRYLSGAMSSTSRALVAAVPQVHIRSTYSNAFGGVEAQVPANKVAAVLRVPGVTAVMKDTVEHPLDDATAFVGATNVW